MTSPTTKSPRHLRRLAIACLLALACTIPGRASADDRFDLRDWLRRPGVRLVVVEFYATWCKPCMRAVPRWKALHEKYADQGLVILGVHAPEFEFEKIRENVVQAALDNDLGWAIAQDNDHETWRAFNNQFWPAKYLIDVDVIRFCQ